MSLGPTQLILIVVLVLILFGAGKLPRVMGDIGKGIRSMKDGLKEEKKGDSNTSIAVEKQEGSNPSEDSNPSKES